MTVTGSEEFTITRALSDSTSRPRPSRFLKSCRTCADLIRAGWQKPLPAGVCCKTGRFSRASRCSRAAQDGPSVGTDISARKGTSVRKPERQPPMGHGEFYGHLKETFARTLPKYL